ncbi:MAG: hypothetical protein F9K29_00345 [Hyphomicrobiaceae bacterium]|nr:MAG: hypothetical protein F9K29_00345 [Hyphomicrobiaceae bacterium]
MPNPKSRPQIADAAAEMMRSCTVATTHTMTASACHALAWWSSLLRGAQAQAIFPLEPSGGRTVTHPAAAEAREGEPDATAPGPSPEASASEEAQSGNQTTYSTYRSAGGHAVAQVIVAT